MEKILIDILIRFRYVLALLSIVITALIAAGGKNLYFESDYKIFFEKDEPQLVAHEVMQETYTKTDNLAIMLRPNDGDIFDERILTMIYEITEQAWQTPYVMRVDSITNFQHTAADGDDLLVEDIVLDPESLTADKIANIREIVLAEKQLVSRLISKDGTTSMINITLELPPEVDLDADFATQAEQRSKRDASHPEVVNFGRELVTQYQQKYTDIEMHLGGVSVITNSFTESGLKDSKTLVPAMYLIILLALAVFLRSVGCIFSSLLVIGCATLAAFGAGGWFGFPLNTVNSTTPVIVLTIAVCDAVHLLSVYLQNLSKQLSPIDAMRESLRLNLQPIILTSVTTAVGFLTLNFSISPPFTQLGNMTAVGVLWAMVLTFTLLPAVTMLLVRKRELRSDQKNYFTGYADFVIKYRGRVLIATLAVAAVTVSFIQLNILDDDPITYFKRGVPFREASEFNIKNLPAVKDITFSIECGASSCISDPTFLSMLDDFGNYVESQPGVTHVSTYVDVIKRLSRSMNRDDQSFYKIPGQADLSAQYNLMYEMSLPYGLDLNNQLNLDKSATKIHIFTDHVTNKELIALAGRAHSWLLEHHNEDVAPGSSVSLMFAHIGQNNIRSMLIGGVFAIIGVTLTILIALRSFKYALISLIPNSVPAFMAFGVWGLLVGQVNMAVAMVFSISLGILVDDTVHFISKYRRARLTKGFTPEQSIHYAFDNVGNALVITTIVLTIGFGLLITSDFNLNAMSGSLTAITIVIALIFDFLVLPPILMMVDRDSQLKA